MDGQEGSIESPGQARYGTWASVQNGEWRRGKAWGWLVSRLLAAWTAEAMPKAAPAQTRIGDHSDHTINRELSLQVPTSIIYLSLVL